MGYRQILVSVVQILDNPSRVLNLLQPGGPSIRYRLLKVRSPLVQITWATCAFCCGKLMCDDVHSEIVRLDRIARRARAHRARGEARGDFVFEIRAGRLEAAAEARLDATVCGER